MYAILLGLAAALGTLPGLFLGMPGVGFVMWPVTRKLCRLRNIEIDPHDAEDPVLKLEGSLVAALGMALGVSGTVAVVGLLSLAPRALAPAGLAGLIAGVSFGVLWRFGHSRHSAAPLVLVTALLAAGTAAFTA